MVGRALKCRSPLSEDGPTYIDCVSSAEKDNNPTIHFLYICMRDPTYTITAKQTIITRFIKPWLETSPHCSVYNLMVLDVPSGLTVNISFHYGYHSISLAI